ncbi:MAG TPA: phosphoenolpyruvate--protein phosphotransferase [Chromatiales bacterium]|nr:phosphoenolpyruvate--protein phosphotransferase [Chromatiales bacterium]
MTLDLTGIGVSRGIAIGRVVRMRHGDPEIYEQALEDGSVEAEVERFRQALRKASEQLHAIRDAIPKGTPSEVAEFIDTHLLMLSDHLLSEVPVNIIREQHCNAEWALKLQRDALVSVFDQMDDPYLRTRRDDIDHVIRRVQHLLLRGEAPSDALAHDLRGRIVVSDELSPADVLVLHQRHAAGLITETGGPLSHSAILARSLNLPAVMGVHHATRLLQDGEVVVLDGSSGMVLAGADRRLLAEYRRRQRAEQIHRRELLALRDAPSRTLDGHTITLRANIELPEEIRAARQVNADGVGLYRTEFFYIHRQRPADEEEQLQDFRRVLRALKGKPLTIRTLDIGGDKDCSAADVGLPGRNPALGLRAIRRCLRDVPGFKPQLRAILRASSYGPVRLMFPMLTSVPELESALALLESVREELRAERRRFDPEMPVGAMIEVPAAALAAPGFAERLDFLSIGTNDLIQYTLAIDRLDEEVNYLYDPLNPAVLRLIRMVIEAGDAAGVPVAMCGEMAGDPRYTRLLLGMGLREFSMPPAALLEVKRIVRRSRLDELSRRCRDLPMTEPEIRALVEALNRDL